MSSSPEQVLRWYPPFAFTLTARRRFSVTSPGRANTVVAIVFGAAFLVAAYCEKTLIMNGPSVGLLEHPGIWVFLVAQVIIPWTVTRSLETFRTLRVTASAPVTPEFLGDNFDGLDTALVLSLERRSNRSKALFDLLLLIGLAAWAWNTFQNQDPIRFLHFDFWDSRLHPGGYWLTRFYKLYVWVMIGPAVVHAQLCLVNSVKRLFHLAATKHAIILDPYDPNGDGGLAPLLESVINPMVPIVIASSLLTMAAFWVHGKYDVTTIGGLAMTIALMFFVYLVPAIALRRAILEEKKRQRDQISKFQRTIYDQLLTAELDRATLKDNTGMLTCLGDLAKRVDGISNWPQLKRIARLGVAAGSSPVLGWAVKQVHVGLLHLFQTV